MKTILNFLTSSLTRKWMMALTGAFLVFFLIIHLSGNLLIFKGPETFNAYPRLLHSLPILPIIEIVLLTSLAYHAFNGIYTKYTNYKNARTSNYAVKANAKNSRRNIAAKTPIFTGIILGIFLPFHIITMKFTDTTPYEHRNVYALIIETFSSPLITAFYIFAILALGFHLFHGLGTLYESFGIAHRKWLRRLLQAFAILLTTIFAMIPALIYFFGDKL